MSALAVYGGRADRFAVADFVTVGSGRKGEANVAEQTIVAERVAMAAERKGVAQGWQVVRGGGRRTVARQGLREGSSGRMVTLPQVWAVAAPQAVPATPDSAPAMPMAPQVAFYRKYTEALLGQYASAKLAAHRAPSPMTQDIVRGHASHTRVSFFDDTLHFCIDVERCLAAMDTTDAKVLRRVAIQGYSYEEAAISMGLSVMSGHRRYGRALDHLTEMLIERRILDLGKLVKG